MYVRMPFGKYRGYLLADIPDGYLLWVLREVDIESPILEEAIREELERRRVRAPDSKPAGSVVNVRSAVATWFREMAMCYHPDRTLDNGAAMKAINHAHERLRELLEIA